MRVGVVELVLGHSHGLTGGQFRLTALDHGQLLRGVGLLGLLALLVTYHK